MHRSGTSCLAGTLEEAGLCLGNVSTTNKYNPKGNRENPDVMKINDELLRYNSASWDQPPEEVKWNETHLTKALELASTLKNNCDSEYWGFKDPRVLLNYPFWESIFPEAILIGTIRNPMGVANSLQKRDQKFHIEKGLKLWLSYNKILLKVLKKKPFPLISFDYSNDIYKVKSKSLTTNLFPNANISENNFFNDSLRSNNIESQVLSIDIENCYTELQTFLT